MKTTYKPLKGTSFKAAKKQKGNYLLSIGIGIMIMAILAVWGIPKIQDYLIEGAVPSVAEETQRFMSRLKVTTSGTGSAPFTGINQEYLARAVRGSVLQVTTAAAGVAGQGTGGQIVRHGLGGGNNGTIQLAVTESGSAVTLTFSNVNHAACPGLATAMQRTADGITINGTPIKTTDASNRNVTLGYVAGTAAAACNDGDANLYVFTLR